MVKVLERRTGFEWKDIGNLAFKIKVPISKGQKCAHCGKQIVVTEEINECYYAIKEDHKYMHFHLNGQCLDEEQMKLFEEQAKEGFPTDKLPRTFGDNATTKKKSEKKLPAGTAKKGAKGSPNNNKPPATTKNQRRAAKKKIAKKVSAKKKG